MTSLRHISSGDPTRLDGRLDGYLDAARACILDVGWRRTTLTEVARRAGVSRMTIYRTWPDMPTLLGDLMTREWERAVDATLADVPPVADPAARTAGQVVAAVRALRDEALFLRILELDPELLLPYLLTRRGRSQDALAGLLTALIEAGQADGSFRAGDPKAMARSLLLATHGHTISVQTMVDDDVDLAALDAELATLIERTLRP